MKQEWKKHEKDLYLPGSKPVVVDVPEFSFFSIAGAGNPNDPSFSGYVEALFSLSYAIKMAPKSGLRPVGYQEYTVYPLEGIWDLSPEGRKNYQGTIRKDDLVFTLMIRQPDFVTADFAGEIMELTRKKKKAARLDEVTFGRVHEGTCLQMMHTGSYDNEPASFKIMEDFCKAQNLVRSEMTHREIYLSDARKVSAEKLKTILRFKVHS